MKSRWFDKENSKSVWCCSDMQNIVFDEPKLDNNASNGTNLGKIGWAVQKLWGNKQKEKKKQIVNVNAKKR